MSFRVNDLERCAASLSTGLIIAITIYRQEACNQFSERRPETSLRSRILMGSGKYAYESTEDQQFCIEASSCVGLCGRFCSIEFVRCSGANPAISYRKKSGLSATRCRATASTATILLPDATASTATILLPD